MTAHMVDLNTINQPAQTLLAAGFSVIPAGADKVPLISSWKPFQDRRMTENEARQHFKNGARLAIVCGKVSGNLECLDIDDPAVYQPFLDLLEMRKPGLPAKLLKRQTPSGGFHLIYRSVGPISGNIKLACSQAGSVKIETRGEGGYFLSAPSPGYKVISGLMVDCPTLTPEEVELIHTTAKAFDERQLTSLPHKTANNDSPGSKFNQAHQVADILIAKGWKEAGRTTAGQGWTRPGKKKGVSGVLLSSTGNFYVWSANAHPLEPGRSYDAFGLSTMYDHGGDFKTAARELAGNGYSLPVASEEWPEPSPLTIHDQADPYPLDALPSTIGAAVQEAVSFVQCPVALAACSALSVVSTVAQGLVDVRRAEKLEGPSSLYLLAIADSGERKTTVDSYFSKPVAKWEAEQAEAAKPAIIEWEAAKEGWTAEKNGLLAGIKEASKNGKNPGELRRKLTDLEKNKPARPKVPRLTREDMTPEATALKLAKEWPVAGILSSEAATVFGSHGMGKDSVMRNLGMLNKLWEAGPLSIDRKTTGSFIVRGVRLTMGLAVQPETVRTFLDNSKGLARGIGFLARFLIAWPKSTQGGRMYHDPPVHWPHLGKFHRRLGALLDNQLVFNDMKELEPKTLELSPEAKAVWVDFHDEVEGELQPGRDMAEAKDVASKAADNAARLAALFHVFEIGTGGSIGPDHMKMAARLAAWHLYEARRFMGEIALPAETRNAAKLDGWLLGYCQREQVAQVATKTILQYGPICTRKKRDLELALNELQDAGRIRQFIDGRRKLVEINPGLLRGDGHGFA